MTFDHITHRLQFASSSMQLSESAQARHLSAIAGALGGAAGGEVQSASPIEPALKRRKLVASLLTAAMLTPAGLAAASDNALPGETLYGVKQVSERVLVLFDREIVARHRIEELEASWRNNAFDEQLTESAQAALSQFASDHPLWGRFHETRTSAGHSTPPPSRASGAAPAGEGASANDDDSPDPAEGEHPDGSIAPVAPTGDDESADAAGHDETRTTSAEDDASDSDDDTTANDHDADSGDADSGDDSSG